MKYTICDRCGSEFRDSCYSTNINLKDEMEIGGAIIKFKIVLDVRASQQVITATGSENISADICPNCAVKLLMKKVMMNNLNFNKV